MDGCLLAMDPPGRRGDEALSCLFKRVLNLWVAAELTRLKPTEQQQQSYQEAFFHDLLSSHWGLVSTCEF